jgi:hypothetical protein
MGAFPHFLTKIKSNPLGTPIATPLGHQSGRAQGIGLFFMTLIRRKTLQLSANAIVQP